MYQALKRGPFGPLSLSYFQESGLYYLQSRYYNPEVGRFLNADSIIGYANILGHNLFTYCNNNAVNKVDYIGEDGRYIELGQGWFCRIDPQDTTTDTQRHIHIWNDRKDVTYAQNDDGSPHDKNNNDQGKLPKWLNKTIQNKTGWNYNGKRNAFYEKTQCAIDVEGITYSFADGTSTYRKNSPFVITKFSTSSYERIYFEIGNVSNSNGHITSMIYLPVLGPISLPTFSFGFSWGMIPIPIMY